MHKLFIFLPVSILWYHQIIRFLEFGIKDTFMNHLKAISYIMPETTLHSKETWNYILRIKRSKRHLSDLKLSDISVYGELLIRTKHCVQCHYLIESYETPPLLLSNDYFFLKNDHTQCERNICIHVTMWFQNDHMESGENNPRVITVLIVYHI